MLERWQHAYMQCAGDGRIAISARSFHLGHIALLQGIIRASVGICHSDVFLHLTWLQDFILVAS